MRYLKLEVYCERDSKGDWGERERYCQMETLEKRQFSISREGGKRGRKEGDRQTLFIIRAAVLVIPCPAGL